MNLAAATAPAAMTGGVVRVGPLAVAAKAGRASAGADFDLRSQTLTIRATLAEPDGGKFWSGPPPSVAVAVAGSLDAPTRRIDAAAFTAGLAAQTIARESDRIAGLEADIRERAFFNRRLKAEQFMRQREAELAAYEADQARIKSEQDRQRVEDELMRASDERAKTPAPATPGAAPHAAAGAAAVGAAVPTPPPAPPDLRVNQPDPTAGGLY